MQILLHRNFEKKFAKIPRMVKELFRHRRDLFLKNPLHPILNNHKLSGDRRGEWSFNVTGDWRVIYIWRAENAAMFLDIDTHSNLYK